MQKFNFYLTLFIGMVLVFSCQKSIETNLASETVVLSNDAKVVDGILQLPSQKLFNDLTKDLAKQQDKLNDFESKFSGFISMRTAFSALTENDAENIVKNGITERYKGFVSIIGHDESQEITRTITDPILATLVNKDGLLMIEGKLYRFEYDKFYVLKLKNGASSRVSFDEKSDGVIVGKITYGGAPNAKITASNTCIQEYWVGNNKRRMAGDIDYSYYSLPGGTFYVNVTLYTKHQRRILGVSWWTTNADDMLLQGSIKIDNGNSVYTDYFSSPSSSDGWIERSYPSGCVNTPAGTICGTVYSNINTFHRAKCNDNVVRYCSLSM